MAVVTIGLGGWIVASPPPPPPSPDPPGAFSFAALGDSPYNPIQAAQYRLVLADLAAHPLRMVIHVGDIFSEPCMDERYVQTLDEFNRLPHPVIYTPGDNEWTDCWEHGQPPLDRLALIRKVFFSTPGESLGGRPVPVEHQGKDDGFPELVENVRWVHEGVVFATFHLVGSFNGLVLFPERTDANDEDAEQRLAAAVSWLQDTFAAARAVEATAVVLAFHANPGLEESTENSRRRVFDRFVSALARESTEFGSPVLSIHGDWHDYTVDQPLIDPETGTRVSNLTRLQVPGSPDVGWVRVTVSPRSADPFAFEPRVIPHWKYW